LGVESEQCAKEGGRKALTEAEEGESGFDGAVFQKCFQPGKWIAAKGHQKRVASEIFMGKV
jgi:hypothetical protein